jgi:membrane protein YdbS with pleckstrin-like domain
VTLGLAILTALGLVLEIFVVEEMLFSRCEYKIRSTIDALEDAILKLGHIVVPRST